MEKSFKKLNILLPMARKGIKDLHVLKYEFQSKELRHLDVNVLRLLLCTFLFMTSNFVTAQKLYT